ncbi:MAG: ParB/RepB/Spo0J family partition protein [Pelolinea sp.]|nr:ParB/RepB/Spo0J family partition protein [Pelolinea sp.]
MSIQEIELDRILPNPFQTRNSEDAEHIQNLVESIRMHGLMQMPTARISAGKEISINGSDPKPMVELAFGHSRFAAFKILREQMPASFGSMPLNIVELTDLQMFEMAVAENRERKDLTPIEEAKAMQRYQDEFKKTSAEVGKLFHLSDSAVRGKMRLLDLPVEIQDKVGRELTEGAARELLTFESLPDVLKAEKIWINGQNITLKERIAEMVQEGASQDELKKVIDSTVEHKATEMSKRGWKNTDELLNRAGEKIRMCKGCPWMITRNDTNYCLDKKCYESKQDALKLAVLNQASLLSGIAILDEDKEEYSHHTSFNYGHEAKLKEILEKRCENLRLKFNKYGNSSTALVEGFENVDVVCDKRAGQCTCLKAMQSGVDLASGEQGITEEERKEMRRQMKEQERIDREQRKHIERQTEIALTRGLMDHCLEAWKTALGKLIYDKESEKCGSFLEVLEFISKRVVSHTTWGDNRSVLRQCNELLEKCGLAKLDLVIDGDEAEQIEPVSQTSLGGAEIAGKSLMEVFEADVEPASEELDKGTWAPEEEFSECTAKTLKVAHGK